MSNRQCYFVTESQRDEYGFIPSLVTENEPDHSPMIGEYATPWYWGKTIERAREVCARVNLQRFGISEQTADRIVASSMFTNAGANDDESSDA